MSRMERINDLLRSELSKQMINNVSLDNGLITIIRVKCSPNLKSATVYISVLPENQAGSALKVVRKSNSQFSSLFKKLNLKNIPKLTWRIDPVERHAAEMDQTFNELE